MTERDRIADLHSQGISHMNRVASCYGNNIIRRLVGKTPPGERNRFL